MHLQRLELKNFRNYKEEVFGFAPKINLIIGDNGSGKSNLLEAVFILMKGRSFRSGPEESLVRIGEDSSVLRGIFNSEEREKKIEVGLGREAGKEIRINGQRIVKLKEIKTAFGVVVFCPEDLRLVKGGPEEKRGFLDEVGGDISAKYEYARINFLRTLKQRNNLLKQIKFFQTGQSSLDVWSERFVSSGLRLIDERRKIISVLSDTSQRMFEQIFGDGRKLGLIYQNESFNGDGPDDKTFLETLRKLRDQEIERGVSLIGPHRDDLMLLIGGKDARLYASQGEQRSISLTLRLSQYELLARDDLKSCVLLLDDVMSELDETRRNNLFKLISGAKQALITGTNAHCFNAAQLEGSRVLEMTKDEREARVC